MPLIQCPDCGKEISDLAPACPNCGRPKGTSLPSTSEQPLFSSPAQKSASLEQRLFDCPVCGTIIDISHVEPGSTFSCSFCRTSFEDEDAPLTQTELRRFVRVKPPASQKMSAKKSPPNALVVLMLVLFFPVGLALMWSQTDGWFAKRKTFKIVLTAILACVVLFALAQSQHPSPLVDSGPYNPAAPLDAPPTPSGDLSGGGEIYTPSDWRAASFSKQIEQCAGMVVEFRRMFKAEGVHAHPLCACINEYYSMNSGSGERPLTIGIQCWTRLTN